MLKKQILLLGDKTLFASGQGHFCFPVDTNLVSEAYVFQLSQAFRASQSVKAHVFAQTKASFSLKSAY